MDMRYPLAQVSYGPEEIAAVVEALNAGQTTCGPRVAAFESAFGHYVGSNQAIMVNSGSSADLLIAFGLGNAQPGEEVLLPAVTWPTQVSSCLQAGYKVRLVDVNPTTLQMDTKDLVTKINAYTVAIFPVHVLGNVGDMDLLVQIASTYELALVEDCCEAMGSRWAGQHVGTFGSAGAFSFFFSHLLNTMEGGMVVCASPSEARTYRLLRSHGWEPKVDYRFWFPSWGFNVRPTEIQGAFGGVQMGRLAGFLHGRLSNFHKLASVTYQAYPELLNGISVLGKCAPAWHGFPLMVAEGAPFDRDSLCRYLSEHQIESRPIIAGNIARQPAVMYDERVIIGSTPLVGADAIHERGLYLGLSSFEYDTGVDYVGEVLRTFVTSL